jgi:chromate reductase
MPTSILAFSGSIRAGSVNTRLLHVVAGAARDAGAEVTVADLTDYDMPIFNEDLEKAHGLPESVKAFKDLLKAHDGLLIASPEYNSSFSPLLKNAIDWASRPREGETPLQCFRGKVAGLVAASPGYFGGYRGLQQVRYVLGNIGVVVLPDMFSLPNAFDAFNEDGSLKDERQASMAAAVGRTLASFPGVTL